MEDDDGNLNELALLRQRYQNLKKELLALEDSTFDRALKERKERVYKLFHSSLKEGHNEKQKSLIEIIINYENRKIPLKLSKSEVSTWKDIHHHVCILLGKVFTETICLQISSSSINYNNDLKPLKIIVPSEKFVEPGTIFEVELINKPVATMPYLPSSLKRKVSSDIGKKGPEKVTNKDEEQHEKDIDDNDKTLEEIDMSEAMERCSGNCCQQTFRDLCNCRNGWKTIGNHNKELIFDFLIHSFALILLAVGLLYPSFAAGNFMENTVLAANTKSFLSATRGDRTPLSFTSNITGINEFWEWMYGPLTEFVLANTSSTIIPQNQNWWGLSTSCPISFNGNCKTLYPSQIARKRWITSSYSTEIIGSIRLRQFRVRSDSCVLFPRGSRIGLTCYEDYSSSTMETNDFGPAIADPIAENCGFTWNSEGKMMQISNDFATPTFLGPSGTYYDASGYMLDIPQPDNWVGSLNYLRANNWTDAATKAITVEMTIRNPNSDLFVSYLALIERDKVGCVRTYLYLDNLRLPENPSSEARFICDLIAFFLVFTILLRTFIGGFFVEYETERKNKTLHDSQEIYHTQKVASSGSLPASKPISQSIHDFLCARRVRQTFTERVWRIWDFCFCVFFFVSFGYDMSIYSQYGLYTNAFTTTTTSFQSLQSLDYNLVIANRLRAFCVLLITFRFLFLESFSYDRVTSFVFLRLTFAFTTLALIFIPFVISLVLLVMILEQGSTVHLVTLKNAFTDLLYLVTGNADRLTAAIPKIGRPTGWSVAFFLFLITLTWVLIVPTLIAFAVVSYERASNSKRAKKRNLGAFVLILNCCKSRRRDSEEVIMMKKPVERQKSIQFQEQKVTMCCRRKRRKPQHTPMMKDGEEEENKIVDV